MLPAATEAIVAPLACSILSWRPQNVVRVCVWSVTLVIVAVVGCNSWRSNTKRAADSVDRELYWRSRCPPLTNFVLFFLPFDCPCCSLAICFTVSQGVLPGLAKPDRVQFGPFGCELPPLPAILISLYGFRTQNPFATDTPTHTDTQTRTQRAHTQPGVAGTRFLSPLSVCQSWVLFGLLRRLLKVKCKIK